MSLPTWNDLQDYNEGRVFDLSEYWEYQEALREQEYDLAAERAFLAHLENDPESDAFEEWERARGCAADPQSGY